MARSRAGNRGSVLIFFGVLDLTYGVSLIAPDERTRAAPLFVWLASIAPIWVWAATWIVVAAICLREAFQRRDGTGYAAAICLNVFWGGVAVGGWLFGGVERGYVSAAIFLGFAWLLWKISGWAEPGDTKGPTWTPPSS
jgi:hypothetical protein